MIRFRLNDRTVDLPAAAAETPLVYTLRDARVGDNTPRVGCRQEQCGACRVLVDGVPAYACTLPTGAARSHHVETAAGLDTPVRRALIDANATQCGYCLPGIVVAAEALFRKDPSPEPAAIMAALEPQLCRCGSHPRVLRALVALAGNGVVEPPPGWSAAGEGTGDGRPGDRPLPPALAATPSLARWIRFPEAGRVVALTGKVEIGQGLLTALAVIVADELDVALDRVSVLSGHTGHTPDEGVTAGSMSIETSGAALRQASAWARKLLLARASERLGVSPDNLTVRDGEIGGPGVNERLDYWELAREGLDAQIDRRVPEKPPEAHALVGREGHRRADVARKATAGAFVHDVPAELHARPVRPPSLHHRLAGLDVEVDPPGVLVVDGSFVAVAHPDEYEAVRLAEGVDRAARWQHAGNAPRAPRLDAARRQSAEALPLRDGVPTRSEWRPAKPRHRARYTRPFLMHGSLGPSAAMAHWTGERLYVECASQGVEPLRLVLARVFGMDAADIELRHVPGAGCYGHNGADDVALDAALVARSAPGRRVLMKWSREDEHAFEPLGPPMHVEIGADLEADGRITTWTHDVYGYTHVSRPHPRAPGVDVLAARWLTEPLAPTRPRPALAPEVGIHRNALPIYRFADTRVTKHFVPDAPCALPRCVARRPGQRVRHRVVHGRTCAGGRDRAGRISSRAPGARSPGTGRAGRGARAGRWVGRAARPGHRPVQEPPMLRRGGGRGRGGRGTGGDSGGTPLDRGRRGTCHRSGRPAQPARGRRGPGDLLVPHGSRGVRRDRRRGRPRLGELPDPPLQRSAGRADRAARSPGVRTAWRR